MANEKPSLTRELFHGSIDDSILFPYPRISDEEDRQVTGFIERLRAYCEANLDREWIDENERIPQEAIEELKRMGLFGISIPKEYGGMGLTQSAYCRVFEYESEEHTSELQSPCNLVCLLLLETHQM